MERSFTGKEMQSNHAGFLVSWIPHLPFCGLLLPFDAIYLPAVLMYRKQHFFEDLHISYFFPTLLAILLWVFFVGFFSSQPPIISASQDSVFNPILYLYLPPK